MALQSNYGNTGKEKLLSTSLLERFKQKHKPTEQPQPQSFKVALQDPWSSSILRSPMDYKGTRSPANMTKWNGTFCFQCLLPDSECTVH